jgi:heme O synthase-like polyprenyltransferase
MFNFPFFAAVVGALSGALAVWLAPRLHRSYVEVINATPEEAEEKTHEHVGRTRLYMASFFLSMLAFFAVLVSAAFVPLETTYFAELVGSGTIFIIAAVAVLSYAGRDADARDRRNADRPQWKPNRQQRRAMKRAAMRATKAKSD